MFHGLCIAWSSEGELYEWSWNDDELTCGSGMGRKKRGEYRVPFSPTLNHLRKIIFLKFSNWNNRTSDKVLLVFMKKKTTRLIIRLFIHFLFSISIFLIEKKKEKKIWEKKNKDNVYFIPFLLAKLLAYLSYSVWKYADF